MGEYGWRAFENKGLRRVVESGEMIKLENIT
jgi:hypothetical protein